MTRMLFAGIALFAAAAAAAVPPARVELTFSVTMDGFRIGEARDVLQHDGRRYEVTSLSEPRGVAALLIGDISRTSRGTVTAAGLRPERFQETGRRGGTRIAEFDWRAGRLTLVHGSARRTVALPHGTLDQTSLAYEMAFRGAAATDFTVHVTDGRGVKEYRYRQSGEEILRTPIGEVKARRYEKVRAPDDRRSFELWLASDRHWLPVRLRYVEKNGDTFDSIITQIRYPVAPGPAN